jgi:hypothetical protein
METEEIAGSRRRTAGKMSTNAAIAGAGDGTMAAAACRTTRVSGGNVQGEGFDRHGSPACMRGGSVESRRARI